VPQLRWGLTLPFAGVTLADHEPLVRRAEAAGYTDLWTGETNGPDGFTPLALAAAWTERMRLGTGVVNPFTRGPAVLGLGASSNVIVERWNEVPFEKPLSRLREVIPVLREVFAGGRGPGGFKLETPPAHEIPIVLAALRDRMLRLGGELADGTFTNFLPLSATEQVVARVREGETVPAQPRDPTEVVCRFFCIPGDGIEVARFMFAAYATVPVYEAFFRGLGWGEAIDPMVAAWRGGDRRAALAAVPEELVREIFIFGSPDEMRGRLDEYAARGITTFVLSPIAPPEQLPDLIDALAR
jgi:alkanesulfonate monooxygenase SsuD/methylene tetrahydromethanopterin reductase-like flavin-dependent oxidoreductase (luciferase family)